MTIPGPLREVVGLSACNTTRHNTVQGTHQTRDPVSFCAVPCNTLLLCAAAKMRGRWGEQSLATMRPRQKGNSTSSVPALFLSSGLVLCLRGQWDIGSNRHCQWQRLSSCATPSLDPKCVLDDGLCCSVRSVQWVIQCKQQLAVCRGRGAKQHAPCCRRVGEGVLLGLVRCQYRHFLSAGRPKGPIRH